MLIIDTTKLEKDSEGLTNSEIYWVYNALDCCVTFDVFLALEKQMDEVSRNTYQVSMATIAPVMEMMLEGMPVSASRRSDVEKHYRDELSRLEKGWMRLCHEGLGIPKDRSKRTKRTPVPVNYSSPKDVQFLFHEILQIPEKKKRKKGKDSATVTTDREALEGFRHYYFAEPFVNFILAMRDCVKALGFLKSPLDKDGKIRCSLNVGGTNTGRLSSSFSDTGTGTNLQNISGKLKDIFEVDSGEMLIDIDLEQGDSRGVGAIAWNWFVESHGEAFAGSYLDACESGDLHTTVTRMAWDKLPWGDDPKGWKAVAKEIAYRDLSYRDLAKRLGHGTNYMGQAGQMASASKLPNSTVVDFQRNYFRAFPCITEWQKETLRQLDNGRCLTTPFGRRRYFWSDPSLSTTRNAAIAYSPQSTTGEFINRGAIQLWHHRNRLQLPISFLLQVHDSLVLRSRWSRRDEIIPVILDKLKVRLPLARGREFTIPHGVKIGWNYGAYDEKENPYGLKGWNGSDDRKPPRRHSSFISMLDTPISQLR